MKPSQKEKTCVITGKVINRPQSTQLRLTKAFVDFRSQSAVLIPIKDSTFNYEFNLTYGKQYTNEFEVLKIVREIVDAETYQRIYESRKVA